MGVGVGSRQLLAISVDKPLKALHNSGYLSRSTVLVFPLATETLPFGDPAFLAIKFGVFIRSCGASVSVSNGNTSIRHGRFFGHIIEQAVE